MQIDPTALYRNDATNGTNNSNNTANGSAPTSGSTGSKTVGGSNAGGGSSSSAPSKPGRGGLISVPRLDLEPIYTELKAAIGEHWAEYKQAVALFLLGMLIDFLHHFR